MLIEKLRKILDDHGGLLAAGSHDKCEKRVCGNELLSLSERLALTDDPDVLRICDLRPINDIDVDGFFRAKHLLPVIAAYAGCMDWPADRKTRTADYIGVQVARRIIPLIPWLTAEILSHIERLDPSKIGIGLENYRNIIPEWIGPIGLCDPKLSVEVSWLQLAMQVNFVSHAMSIWASSDHHAKVSREVVFEVACRIWLDGANGGV